MVVCVDGCETRTSDRLHLLMTFWACLREEPPAYRLSGASALSCPPVNIRSVTSLEAK